MPNSLARSTSPYLQQHAHNPVDWVEWGDEAFATARERDVPVLISVGYSACHWCHVMAHESFEDPAVADLMNAHFVNIKVDREERPDVDAVYMAATQAMTGHGGWPMTVFTTPEGEPFYCGTYFPPTPVQGMPSFTQVLTTMADAWSTRRAEVTQSATAIREALAGRERAVGEATALAGPTGTAATGAGLEEVLDRAETAIAQSYDAERGGFGPAPKFPPSMVLAWLLRRAARRPDGPGEAFGMARHTLEAMARGGIYDQLGGGFARYSVDAAWVVPHFEKMLYDNALLLRAYVQWWRAETDERARAFAARIVTETADWMVRELRTPEGGFASALDADSPDADGVSREGAFSVWTPVQLRDALGAQDAAWAADLLGVTEAGTFEHGASVLQRLTEPTPAPGGGRTSGRGAPSDQEALARFDDVRRRLLAARDQRPRPARDDKVVAAWNGLAVAALAEAGVLLDRPDWVEAARAAARLVVDVHLVEPGRLLRTSRDGAPGTAAGVLEDYAGCAEGFLALYQATGEETWVEHAGGLLDAVLDRFGQDPTQPGGQLHDTAVDETDAVLARIRRPRDITDGPTPGGPPAAAAALLTYAALTGSHRHRAAAEQALAEPLQLSGRFPRATGWALATAEALADGPREVAVVGPVDDPATRALHRAALAAGAPGAVVVVGEPDRSTLPLLLDRPMLEGRPTAYVCRGFVCDRPTTDPAELGAQLRG
ncbi:thioredoxin domain-containing protein [Actinotalea sp. BY-33]|uniref:Thioredoxin domain-containing protein n=1 Tax=Actinotalea soli TaxID=2819234 RepID=A0A939RSV9_9CELL|nr:thioredoxin domain-containing protein [Actinotalea soli]MBO1752662.1 thioredoxin domain-containing protein [Actinotalea soli]